MTNQTVMRKASRLSPISESDERRDLFIRQTASSVSNNPMYVVTFCVRHIMSRCLFHDNPPYLTENVFEELSSSCPLRFLCRCFVFIMIYGDVLRYNPGQVIHPYDLYDWRGPALL